MIVTGLVLHFTVADTILSTDTEDILCYGNWLIIVQKGCWMHSIVYHPRTLSHPILVKTLRLVLLDGIKGFKQSIDVRNTHFYLFYLPFGCFHDPFVLTMIVGWFAFCWHMKHLICSTWLLASMVDPWPIRSTLNPISHLFVHPSIQYPSIQRQSIHVSIYSSIYPYINFPSIRPSVRPSVRPSIHQRSIRAVSPSYSIHFCCPRLHQQMEAMNSSRKW